MNQNNRWILLMSGELLLGVLYAIWCYYETNSATFSVLNSLILVGLAIGFSNILKQIHAKFHPRRPFVPLFVGLIVLFSVITIFGLSGICRLSPFSALCEPFYSSSNTLLHILSLIFVLLFVSNQLWLNKHEEMQIRIVEELVGKERALVRSELSNIHEQFRPHFLFNSLNSISSLTLFAPDKAREMIEKLSDFLRISINHQSDHFHPLSDEIHYLKLYLDIEKIRFEDRLTIHWTVPETMDNLVPAMICQPLIENAIKYGVYSNTGKVDIQLEISFHSNYTLIKIQNPMDEVAIKSSKGQGYGLSAIRKRLYYLFGRNDLLETKKEETIFCVNLKIPAYEARTNH